MSDAIVDLVETGQTLKANGLEIIEKIQDITARLIVNKQAIKEKSIEIYEFVNRLEEVKPC